MAKKNDDYILCSALAYLLIGIIWFFLDEKMRHDGFVKFHVQQAMVFLIMSMILQFIAGLSLLISWILTPLIGAIILVFLIIGIVHAVTGKKRELPIIGEYGRKILI
jgi:uncharacterized membrane protein